MSDLISNSPADTVNEGIDDLKQIAGIGPAIERRLHAAGITTFAQLGELTLDDLSNLFADMTGLSSQRLAEKNWIGQAQKLSASSPKINLQIEAKPPENRQHYAVFTLEFLLDESNIVRRTRAFSVQNQSETTWAGYDWDRLVDFLSESMGMRAAQSVKYEPVSVVSPAADAPKHTAGISETKLVPQAERNEFIAQRLEVWTDDAARGKQKMITSNAPVNISLTLDLSQVHEAQQSPYEYEATVYARQVGSKAQEIIGRSQGKLVPAEYVRLNIEGKALAQGIYHVEAIITLVPPEKEFNLRNAMMAMTESGLIQVY